MIGVYGGSFDPVHLGHLGVASAALSSLNLDQVIFVPNGQPPHRDNSVAGNENRLRLLQMALRDFPKFEIDDHEINKPSTSWTIETLEYFREQWPQEAVCLIVGSDAFRHIDSWHRWQELLDFAHIQVVSRKGDSEALPRVVQEYLKSHQVDDLNSIQFVQGQTFSGAIQWLDADVPGVSSTEVRTAIQSGANLTALLPEIVASTITEEKIYA